MVAAKGVRGNVATVMLANRNDTFPANQVCVDLNFMQAHGFPARMAKGVISSAGA